MASGGDGVGRGRRRREEERQWPCRCEEPVRTDTDAALLAHPSPSRHHAPRSRTAPSLALCTYGSGLKTRLLLVPASGGPTTTACATATSDASPSERRTSHQETSALPPLGGSVLARMSAAMSSSDAGSANPSVTHACSPHSWSRSHRSSACWRSTNSAASPQMAPCEATRPSTQSVAVKPRTMRSAHSRRFRCRIT